MQFYFPIFVFYLFKSFLKTKKLMKDNIKNVRYPHFMLAEICRVTLKLLFAREEHFL